MTRGGFVRQVSAIVCLVVFALGLSAQNDRGTITGEVRDPAGALVPNAAVTATNRGTGAGVRTATTATGNYTIPSLTAGIYSLTVEDKGFKRFIQENIEIQVATTKRVDVALEVGGHIGGCCHDCHNHSGVPRLGFGVYAAS